MNLIEIRKPTVVTEPQVFENTWLRFSGRGSLELETKEPIDYGFVFKSCQIENGNLTAMTARRIAHRAINTRMRGVSLVGSSEAITSLQVQGDSTQLESCDIAGGDNACVTQVSGHLDMRDCDLRDFTHHGVEVSIQAVSAFVRGGEIRGNGTDHGSAFRSYGSLTVQDVSVRDCAALIKSTGGRGVGSGNVVMKGIVSDTVRLKPSIGMHGARYHEIRNAEVNGYCWCYGGTHVFNNVTFRSDTGRTYIQPHTESVTFDACNFGQSPWVVSCRDDCPTVVTLINCVNIPLALTAPNSGEITVDVIGGSFQPIEIKP